METHIRRQAFLGELIQHVQDPDLPTVLQFVLDDVVAPNMVDIFRRSLITGIGTVATAMYSFPTLAADLQTFQTPQTLGVLVTTEAGALALYLLLW